MAEDRVREFSVSEYESSLNETTIAVGKLQHD